MGRRRCYPRAVTRLAVVGPSWPHRGGIARTTTALASALDARGSLAGFFVPWRQYPSAIYPGRADTDSSAGSAASGASRAYGVLEPWSWPGFARRLRRLGPDALVVPYWTAAWAPFALYVAARSRVPVVAVVHNPSDHDAGALARAAAGAVLRRCRGFVCHATAVAATLRARFAGTPVAVHPLPAEPPPRVDRGEARARLRLRPDTVAVLSFGLIRPYKGIDVLLDAVSRLPRDCPVTLLLAGEPWGGLGASVRRRLAMADLDGRVVANLGWVPEAEAGAWFGAADAVVLPYRSATGSAVAAQALAWSLPLVASAVGGINDVVEDGVNGLLVAPGDAPALASALARIADGGLRSRLAAGARASAGRWTWDGYAATVIDLAGRVTAPRGTERGDGDA